MKADGNTRIYVCGVGGQGSLTASRLLGEAAVVAGLSVTVSEVHGMSQRGGIVESTVLIGGAKSPLIGRGDTDLLLAFEPLEALRALPFCSKKTVAVVNSRPIIPYTVTMGQGEYPDVKNILVQVQQVVSRLIAFDATALAEEAGNAQAVNAVLLGAVAKTGSAGVDTDTIRKIVTTMVPKKFEESNRKAFELGYNAAN